MDLKEAIMVHTLALLGLLALGALVMWTGRRDERDMRRRAYPYES